MHVIVDTSNLLYRGLYAFSRFTSLYSGSEKPTGHIYAVIRTATSLASDKRVEQVYFTRDLQPKKKLELFPDYKDGRSKKYNVHKDFQSLSALFQGKKTFKFIEREDTEADDIIAVLAKHLASKGKDVVIYTGDNDMLPLLVNPNIRISRSFKDGKMEFLDSTMCSY